MIKIIIIFLLTILFLIFSPISEGFENQEPIDIVYTWVDGSDPEWIKKKNEYQINSLDNSDKRFKNINELKYSLRSVEKFIPWVNHIYIVIADGQKINFLKDYHPKITIVKHSEIFKHQNDLPTFNSHAIESNLQNIPNLSEHFLYFNDDLFVGNYLKKVDILAEKPYYYSTSNCNINGNATPEDEGWVGGWKNNFKILNKTFKDINKSWPWHHPVLCKKSLMNFLNNKYPKEFQRTSRTKFRNYTDIAPIGFSLKYGELTNKYNKKEALSNQQIDFKLSNKNDLINFFNNVIKIKPIFFCVNNFEPNENQNLFLNFLNLYYPQKSSFEK